MMEDEVLFWSRLNGAMASFCHQTVLEDDGLQGLVSSLVGDDLEWCGPLALTYTTRKYIEAQSQCHELNMRCKFLENSLSNELLVVANLRNKLKQSQTEASDNEWRLQEQIAILNGALVKEKAQNHLLEMRNSIPAPPKRYNSNNNNNNNRNPNNNYNSIIIREDAEHRVPESQPNINMSTFNNNIIRNKTQPEDSTNNSKSNISFDGKENGNGGKLIRKNSGIGLKDQQRSASKSNFVIEL